MEKIYIHWGADEEFEDKVSGLDGSAFLVDIMAVLNQQELVFHGQQNLDTSPIDVENLIIHTDDYGGIREWAMLGFSNNVLKNLKVDIKNVWFCNPPSKIYEDVCRTFDKSIIEENSTDYPEITLEMLRKIADGFDENVIGQSQVITPILSAIYGLKKKRNKPVTLLFLGKSGIGKTEAAKYISTCIGTDVVRIQCSMQQTNNAYQYVFGAEHGEDSLARELIRRKSNVVLLDEFDKVNPAFYNAFYQMFDEGLFVDSNYSVDVSKCVIICTTNFLTDEEAEKNLGMPIYSRFSKVIRFQSISPEDRLKIAKIYYKQLLNELSEEDKILINGNDVLSVFESYIQNGLYENIRLLKTDIEDAINYEILKAQHIVP